MEHCIGINIYCDEISLLIPHEADTQWVDGLGEAKYWYGDCGRGMFVLESLIYEGGGTNVVFPLDREKADDWDFLKILEELDLNFLKNVYWVRNVGSGDHSLFYKENNIVFQLYRNTEKSNAEALKSYLLSHFNTFEMCVAEVEKFESGWSGSSTTKNLCHYGNRSSVEVFVENFKSDQPEEKTEILCDEGMPDYSWGLYRQDDNSNRFHMMNYQFHVDALFAAMEFESLGHKQTYWVEKKANKPMQFDRFKR